MSPEALDGLADRLEREAQDDEGRLRQEEQRAIEFQRKADESRDSVAATMVALATYQLKEQRQTLDLRLNFNKYRPGTFKLRFDQNIGDLRRHLEDDSVFRSVNLDDPLFKQREIAVSMDGSNASDFAEYINYVTVQMRKLHEGGEPTIDEVRIDRDNFSTKANNFKLLYGWKNDANRDRWMEYEHRSFWSFFGGNVVEEPWRESKFGTIPLYSPYERRFIDLDADPDEVEAQGIRAIVVTVYYELGGEEKSKRTTLKTTKGQFADRIEFMLPVEKRTYDYEITWLRRGNQTMSSGRQTTDSPILFLSDLPEAGGA